MRRRQALGVYGPAHPAADDHRLRDRQLGPSPARTRGAVGGGVRAERRAARTAAPHRQRRHQERRHATPSSGWPSPMPASRCSSRVFKLALNVYRGWVSEDAVRTLRKTMQDVERSLARARERCPDAEQAGSPHRHGRGRGRADRRLRRHGDLRAAAAGRHPGERDRLHDLPRAVDVGAERGLPAAAAAVRAAAAAGHQPPRRRAHQDPAPGQRRHRR